jgi:hypothetical protein
MGIEKFIRRIAVQTAVYWGNPVDDGYGGLTFDDPVEIKCRWDISLGLRILSNSEILVSKTGILASGGKILVNQDLDVKGYLMLGVLNDLDSDQIDNPKEIENSFQIIAFSKVSMIRSTTEFVRTVFI